MEKTELEKLLQNTSLNAEQKKIFSWHLLNTDDLNLYYIKDTSEHESHLDYLEMYKRIVESSHFSQLDQSKERMDQLRELSTRLMMTASLKVTDNNLPLYPVRLPTHPDFVGLGLPINNEKKEPSELELIYTKINSELKEIKESLKRTQKEVRILKQSFIDNVANSYLDDRKIQFIDVEIYLDTNDAEAIIDIYNSVLKYITALDFVTDIELPAVFGSWYKKLLAKSKAALTSEEVVSRLKEVEYGMEVNGILKPQSEVEKNQSEALVNMMKCLENIPNGMIRIGSILAVKVTNPITNIPHLHVRTLAISEIYFLNKNPHLSSSPMELLEALANHADDPSDSLN
ncbi:MAG: hypothetical protein K0Q95_2153 [Bacteroidota bacterium]|jgi:hypothetical protein|nr:hypothetical protein [Bacteroidota bacterium]